MVGSVTHVSVSDYRQSCILIIHGIHSQAIIRSGNGALTYRQNWKSKSRLIYLLVEDDDAAEKHVLK